MTKRSLSPKFATRELLVVVAFVALGCAAVASPSDAWVAILRLIVSASLLFAVLGMIYRQGTRRAFCIGYALCGFTCALTAWLFPQHLSTGSVVAAISEQYGHTLSPPQIESRLSREKRYLESKLTRMKATMPISPRPQTLRSYRTMEKQLKATEQQYSAAREARLLVEVVNSLYPLIAGFVGGSAASWFFRTKDEPNHDKDRQPQAGS